VRRRGDLTGWILMGVLFIAAMALIFYILLLRAQHLSSMEQQRRDPDPGATIERLDTAHQHPPVVLLQIDDGSTSVPHELQYQSTAL
jgi:hypothetical protein